MLEIRISTFKLHSHLYILYYTIKVCYFFTTNINERPMLILASLPYDATGTCTLALKFLYHLFSSLSKEVQLANKLYVLGSL